MANVLLLLTVVVLAIEQTPSAAPVLSILSVTPPEVGDMTGTCKITLANIHSTKAVAWVIEPLEGARKSGQTTDFAITPGGGLPPKSTHNERVACPDGVPQPVLVAAVLYENGSVGGDAELLERRILSRRRKHAAGLRELVGLVQSGRVQATPGAPLQQGFSRLIDQSVGPDVSPIVRAAAKGLLDRLIRALPQAQASDERALRQQLIVNMNTLATALEAVEVKKGVR